MIPFPSCSAPAFLAIRSSLVVLSILALASCHSSDDNGGSGGGGSSDSDSRVDIGVTDAPVDLLAAFRVQIDELVLLGEDDAETPDLLADPLEVEFLGLDGTFAWVASADLPEGTYSGARVRFVPDSIEAISETGESIDVHASDEPLVVSFAAPIVLSSPSYHSISIDLDLGESLTVELDDPVPALQKDDVAAPLEGDATHPPLLFAPEGSISFSDGSDVNALDELEARFVRLGTAESELVVHAFGADGQLDLGEVEVGVAAAVLLVSEEGDSLTADEFFAALLPEQTQLEIHGSPSADGIQASLIEIEDLDGDGTGGFPIKIEGLVLEHELNVGFEILILEIEEGHELVEPELEELGNPSSIDVVYDPSTLFLAEDGGGILGPEALVPGQRVKVEFAQFLSSPFSAGRVDLVDLNPRVGVTVVDVAGLPLQVVVHVDPGETVLGNQVETSETDVLVDLEGAAIVVDTQGEPTLTTEQLLLGSRFQVDGPIAGTPTEPTIDAVQVKVRPGRLEGARVSSIDRAASSFTTEEGQVVEPFVPGIEAGTVHVTFDPLAILEEDAATIEEFFDLFESLVAPQMLRVEIEGIGTGEPNAIRTFEVEARVE